VNLRTLDDLGDVAGTTLFVRADLNVPLEDGAVADDARIRATIPTLQELLGRDARLVIASHLGRPMGTDESLRLAPVGARLGELHGRDVVLTDEVAPDDLTDAPITLLENLRFDPGEEPNDTTFAGRLAELADGYVNDAFGAAHRKHASVFALPELMVASGRPAVAGRLLEREVDVLSRLLHAPDAPFVAILGGAKVSDKIAVIDSLIDRVDALLIGGAMAFTFIAAEGGEVGASLIEEDRFEDVRAARRKAAERGVLIELPQDVVVAPEASLDARRQTVSAAQIPRGTKGLDIGPRSVEEFARIVADAKTILWNGPMGVFELEPFSAGTRGVALAVAGCKAFSVVGGGDSLLAVKRAGLEDSFDHLSTGGGAMLEFLQGAELPGIAVLEDR
jgi:phosphoglycerate kinase